MENCGFFTSVPLTFAIQTLFANYQRGCGIFLLHASFFFHVSSASDSTAVSAAASVAAVACLLVLFALLYFALHCTHVAFYIFTQAMHSVSILYLIYSIAFAWLLTLSFPNFRSSINLYKLRIYVFIKCWAISSCRFCFATSWQPAIPLNTSTAKNTKLVY